MLDEKRSRRRAQGRRETTAAYVELLGLDIGVLLGDLLEARVPEGHGNVDSIALGFEQRNRVSGIGKKRKRGSHDDQVTY